MNIKRRRGKPISKQQVKRAAAREEAEWARLFTGSADGLSQFTTRPSLTVTLQDLIDAFGVSQ